MTTEPAGVAELLGEAKIGPRDGAGKTVVVNKGDKVPDISPPTKLYIKGVTADECDHMGGWFDDAITTCKNVDY